MTNSDSDTRRKRDLSKGNPRTAGKSDPEWTNGTPNAAAVAPPPAAPSSPQPEQEADRGSADADCEWFFEDGALTIHTSRRHLRSLCDALSEIEAADTPGVTHLLLGEGSDVGPLGREASSDGQPVRVVSVYVWH